MHSSFYPVFLTLFLFLLSPQIQQDKAAQLLNAAANQTALAAIGQRKRPLADVGGPSGSSQSGSSSDGSSSAASLFASLVSFTYLNTYMYTVCL